MADTSKSPKKSWTEAEKLQLVLAICEPRTPIQWNNVTLPEGRTIKACQLAWGSIQSEAKMSGGIGGTATKRKSDAEKGEAAAATSGDGEGSAGAENVDEETPSKKKKAAPKKPKASKKKQQPDEEEQQADKDFEMLLKGEDEEA